MSKTYIMAVTADEYELPISPPFPSQRALAAFLKVDCANICRDLKAPAGRKFHKRRYVKVELDEDE